MPSFRPTIATTGPWLLGIVLSASAGGQCTAAIQQNIDEKRLPLARDQVQAILARTPGDDQAEHCWGVVLTAMDRPREALGHFEKAAKLNDKSSLHHLWIGNSLGDLADSTSKIKLPFLARRVKSEFERAVELDPRSLDGRNGLIEFYTQAPGVMGGSIDKAKEQAREIGKFNPLRGHFAMGNILLRDKKVPEAEAEFLAAIKDAPDSSAAWFGVGSYYQGREKWTEAFELYDKMLKQFPSEAMVHFQIGRTSALSGQQLDRGEAELKGWIASPPKNVVTVTLGGAHHRLGMIYEKQGKKDLARAEYNRALSIDPSNENAKRSLAALK